MIKLVYCITKKPGLSDEAFFHYWKEIHGPIGAKIPGLRKLVQSHTLPAARAIRPPDFDGMAELWFDDLEALLAARKTIEWQLSSDDEANFIDHSKVAFFITQEHQLV
jgi:uncharacterized protein (TIGR02118 family)